MNQLAWVDLALLLDEAGWRPGEELVTALALIQPESDRYPRAHNPTDPNGGSFGLLQVNGIHDPAKTGGPHPDWAPTTAWIEQMMIPLENLKAGRRVYLDAGRSFKPWGAFTSSLHLPFLPHAKIANDARGRLRLRDSQIATLRAKLASLEPAVAERDLFAAKIANAQRELADVQRELA